MIFGVKRFTTVSYTYSFSRFIIECASYIDRTGHILYGKRTNYVTARDLISNTRCCRMKKVRINFFYQFNFFKRQKKLSRFMFQRLIFGYWAAKSWQRLSFYLKAGLQRKPIGSFVLPACWPMVSTEEWITQMDSLFEWLRPVFCCSTANI